MAGIDFGSAALERREAFAFTKAQAARGMHEALCLPGVRGCVIYSTCNRTELWLCVGSPAQADPASLLYSLKEIPPAQACGAVQSRSGGEAVRHLFETSCGLRSRIWGEDQIIAQIKEADRLAMDEGTSGKVLHKLFQTAVTSAKRVKTQVRFSSGSASVAAAVVEKCRELRGPVRGLRCLVIGSGAMGALAAGELSSAGAKVRMTLRRYKYGISAVPERCAGVPYEDRVGRIADADLVVSATASPHRTLPFGPVAEMCAAHPRERLFFDLAVPRDIDPEIAGLPHCRLLTIDDLSCGVREEEKARTEAQCREIIDHYIGEFEKQLAAWASLPAVQRLSDGFASSLRLKLAEELGWTDLGPEDRERLEKAAQELLRRESRKLLFSFRDWMEDHAGKLPDGGKTRAKL